VKFVEFELVDLSSLRGVTFFLALVCVVERFEAVVGLDWAGVVLCFGVVALNRCLVT
jgi:hypothetical protein